MTSFSRCFDWLCRHRRSVQGLERLWRPTPAIRSQQQSVKRRRWTLLTITICLHVLLWSSVIPLITMLALFAAQKIDTTVLPSTVLTIVSAVASISYIVLHSVVSRRQDKLQHGVTSKKFENVCYIAIRFAVTLCILWLLTSGWNFIIAARQPVCLSKSSTDDANEGWKVGSSCAAERFSAAISFIALVASCTLFGILAVVRRPFEANLLGPSSSSRSYMGFYHGRKFSHPEDGVYNPALRHVHPSTSTLTSLTASSFLRPDTAMTDRRASVPSTPGPSFPSTPSTGDAIIHHFSWVPSPRPGSGSSSNGLGIPSAPLQSSSSGATAGALLPAAPICALTTTAAATTLGSPLRYPARPRRISSAESVMQTVPCSSSSLQYTPTYQRRSLSYGQVSSSPSSSPAAATLLPPLPPRAARSPPSLDSAWRAVHPHPPPNTAVVAATSARMSLNVSKARARPPSMPQFSSPPPPPPQQQQLLQQATITRESIAVGAGTGLALTSAALASLTAQSSSSSSPSSSVSQQAQVSRRPAYHRHKRTLTPSGPPPALPPSVRPVVIGGRGGGGFDAAPYSASSSSAAATFVAGGVLPSATAARPRTPIQQTGISTTNPYYNNIALAPSPALLSLQQRAARQRPLGLRPRRSFGNGGGGDRSVVGPGGGYYCGGGGGGGCGGSQYSLSSSSGTMRSSSSPLSTMVRACEVEVEALREEMKVAEGVRRGVLGEDDAKVEGGTRRRELDVAEQIRGVERTGRWCRARRGWGGAGEGNKKKKDVVVKEEVTGDLGVEGRNWVRSASGEESVSERDEGTVAREREDSGVELGVGGCGVVESSSSAESSSGALEGKRQDGPVAKNRGNGLLLPSWNGGLSVSSKTSSSPEQSFLEAVLAAGSVTPLLQQQPGGGEQRLRSTSSSGGDVAVLECCAGGDLSRSGTIVVRRTRSLEELQQQRNGKIAAVEGTRSDEPANTAGVGLGLNWLVGVDTGVYNAGSDGRKTAQRTETGTEWRSLDVKRVPRTRPRTLGLG